MILPFFCHYFQTSAWFQSFFLRNAGKKSVWVRGHSFYFISHRHTQTNTDVFCRATCSTKRGHRFAIFRTCMFRLNVCVCLCVSVAINMYVRGHYVAINIMCVHGYNTNRFISAFGCVKLTKRPIL